MVKVSVELPADIVDAGEFLADARALEAAGADTIWLHAGRPEQWMLLGAVAALTQRIRIGVLSPKVGGHSAAVLDRIGGGRLLLETPKDEKWRRIPMPSDRQAWRAALDEQEKAGCTGVVVPWDSRLIDLLRNPDGEDRSDLLMSTG